MVTPLFRTTEVYFRGSKKTKIKSNRIINYNNLPQLIRKNERKFQNRQVTAERGPHNNMVG